MEDVDPITLTDRVGEIGSVGDQIVEHPTARGYVLDDVGAVRKHVAVFVDGARVRDRERLTDPVGPESEIHVLQALTGG